MKWILIFIMFNNGLHYAQSQPIMYDNYDQCKASAAEVKKLLTNTRPSDDAYAMTFCVALPSNV
jgi:hypothetical protein